ncbi:hypothetical protein ABEY51_28545 [Priestia megaterium]
MTTQRRYYRRRNKSGDNTSEQPKKGGVLALQDTAWIITILTALCYFFSYSFQKGIRSYYETDSIVLSELDIPSIVDSVYEVSSLVLKICFIYFLSKLLAQTFIFGLRKKNSIPKMVVDKLKKRLFKENSSFHNFFKKSVEWDFVRELDSKDKFLIKMEKEMKESNNPDGLPENLFTNLLFVNLIIIIIPVLMYTDPSNFSLLIIILYLVLTIILIQLLGLINIFIIFTLKISKVLFFRREILGFVFFVLYLLNKKNPVTYIWKKCDLGFRVILILTAGIGFSTIFFQFGYTKSENNTDYKVAQFQGEEFIILDKDKNRMLISPLRIIKKQYAISSQEFQFIELKQEKANTLVIKNQKFENGLKVVPKESEPKIRVILNEGVRWLYKKNIL